MLRLVPENRRPLVEEFIDVLSLRLRGWISGMALVASFVGVGAGLRLWLIGIPLPLTLGIIAGILNIIPCSARSWAGFCPCSWLSPSHP